jgi:hypothetical protein
VYYNYDSFGKITKKRLSDGSYTLYTYDVGDNVIQKSDFGSDAGLLLNHKTTYNVLGQKIAEGDWNSDEG